MPNVDWSQQALADLEEIAVYIGVENRNPQAADRLLDQFRERADAYSRPSGMGTLHDDLESPPVIGLIRSFRVKTYLAFYRETPNGIFVLRVLHGRRDYRTFF